MITIKNKTSSVLKYHGGKTYLAKDIVSLIDDCKIFVDATFGGGSILLKAQQSSSRMDIAIDKDEDLMRMWNTVKFNSYDLHKKLKDVKYCAEEFEGAKEALMSPIEDDVEFSKNFIVRSRMSRGGLNKDFAWSDRLRGGLPGDINAWNNFVDHHYYKAADRISHIRLLTGCFKEYFRLLEFIDDKDTCVYIDPPYVKSSRTSKSVYKHEMETYEKDGNGELTHEGMWKLMDSYKCKFYISGYANDAYNQFIQRMNRRVKVLLEKDIANHSGQNKNKQRRKEMLWGLV